MLSIFDFMRAKAITNTINEKLNEENWEKHFFQQPYKAIHNGLKEDIAKNAEKIAECIVDQKYGEIELNDEHLVAVIEETDSEMGFYCEFR